MCPPVILAAAVVGAGVMAYSGARKAAKANEKVAKATRKQASATRKMAEEEAARARQQAAERRRAAKDKKVRADTEFHAERKTNLRERRRRSDRFQAPAFGNLLQTRSFFTAS